MSEFLQFTCRTEVPWKRVGEGWERQVSQKWRDLSQQHALQAPGRPVGATGELQEL